MMMANEASDSSKMLEKELNPVNEEVIISLLPTKEKLTEELTSKNKQEVEGEFQPETSAEKKGEDASGGQGTHQHPMEKGEGLCRRLFVGDVATMPELAVVEDPLPEGAEEMNADIKRELKKEIQNLGYGYQYIFQLLDEVQGPLEIKREIVLHAIKEAVRFNCHDLTVNLESTLKKINCCLNRDDDPPDI
ncbi:uncharacterized protein RHO17_003408 [Thomomys bottae]